MENLFDYSQSARRRAKKQQALAAGQAAQQGASKAEGQKQAPRRKVGGPLWEHRPPRPRNGAQRGPSAQRGVPRPTASRAVARAPGGPRRPPVPGRPGAPGLPAAQLQASEERLLLESSELDLFGTGKSSKVAVCPECRHELVPVVCLGVSVRVCVECRGTWVPYAVVQEFARKDAWFQQLGQAAQRAIALSIEKKSQI